MRYLLPLVIFVFHGAVLSGQNINEAREGKISYITSQDVYVKFLSTENILPGDTLFLLSDGKLFPAVTVKEISSISCVCVPFIQEKLSVGDKIYSKKQLTQPITPSDNKPVPGTNPVVVNQDTINASTIQPGKRRQVISGNFSVASYLDFSNVTSNTERMKYTFAMVMQNIGNSKLSAETYICFSHKLGDWSAVQSDIFNGLKIYSLALNYEFNKHNTLWIGRKINPRISNVGAIDGIQYELKAGSISVGVIGGTRPDTKNYSFNPDLIQFGGYVGHDLNGKNGNMQTTIAFIDQLNTGKTDRRFAYLQYTNSLVRNLYFFGSVEVDLYKKTMNPVDTALMDTTYKVDNSPTLSNLYLSLRYRPVRRLSLSVSYSARQNVIYYETYKSLVERLLQEATVQGFIFQVNYQPVNALSIGVNAGYRNSKNDPRATKNLYGYVSYNQIPGINAGATISATLLETSYMSGQIYSCGITKDLVSGKLSGEIGYRYVSYKFQSGETKLVQNMAEVNLTWRILRKLSCGIYYEGTFDKSSLFNRLYLNITQRF